MRLIASVVLLVASLACVVGTPTPTKEKVEPDQSTVDALLHYNVYGAGTSSVVVAPAPVPASQPTTNAQRLKAGLPPLPPKHREINLGKRTLPSPKTYSGVLKLLDGNGNFFGYVSRTLNDYRVYGTTTSRASALTVTFAYSSRKNVFELSSGGTAPYSFVGGTTYLPRGEIRPGDSNFAYLTSTVHTPAGVTPRPVENSLEEGRHSESTIWKYNPATKKVTAVWVNANGATYPTFLLRHEVVQGLLLTGDVHAFRGTYGSYHPELTLVLD